MSLFRPLLHAVWQVKHTDSITKIQRWRIIKVEAVAIGKIDLTKRTDLLHNNPIHSDTQAIIHAICYQTGQNEIIPIFEIEWESYLGTEKN